MVCRLHVHCAALQAGCLRSKDGADTGLERTAVQATHAILAEHCGVREVAKLGPQCR